MEEKIVIKNIKTNKSFLQPVKEELKSDLQGQQKEFAPNFSFGFFRITKRGELVFANSALIKLIGFESLEELSEKINHDKYLKNNFSAKKYSSFFKDTFGKESLTNNWIKKNGQSILLKEYIQPVENETGEIIFFDIVVEDITEKEFSKRLINDIKVGDYSIFKALPDILFVVSSEGTFIEWKTNNYNNLFPRSSFFKGKSVNDLFPEPIARQFLSALESTIRTGELQTFEFQLGDAAKLQFFEARFAITSNDQVLIILREITEQKQSEFKIKKFTEELEQINKTKDKFFAIIGHDLRTPINGLLGYSEILVNDIEILGKEEIKEYASSIMDISKTTNNLLTNLLEWSRVQTGRITFQPCSINLCSNINMVIDFLNANAQQKNIELNNLVDPGTIIYADENMLQSILMNLCGNAIKFTNRDGIVKIYCTEEKDNFVILVEDNGLGISKLNLKNLLKENSYFSTYGTAKERGTGLGLILCKEFIEKHSGKIWVESCEGKGTTFYFTIAKKII